VNAIERRTLIGCVTVSGILLLSPMSRELNEVLNFARAGHLRLDLFIPGELVAPGFCFALAILLAVLHKRATRRELAVAPASETSSLQGG
jgi:hypothetical protein